MEEWTEYRCGSPCNKLLCKYELTEDPYAFEIKCPHRKCHKLNYRGNVITINLVEFRCPEIDPKKSEKRGEDTVCGKLLCYVLPGTKVQIKCPRCGAIIESPDQTMDDTKDED